MPDVTKLCPYCAEEIRAEARKCRYCGSFVESRTALSRTWYRRRHGKMLAGVCAGLADQFGISVTIVRLAFVLGALPGMFVSVIIYFALWVIMPYGDAEWSEERPAAEPPARPIPPESPTSFVSR